MFTDEELIFIHGVLVQAPLNYQQSITRLQIMSKIENQLNNKDDGKGNEKEKDTKEQKI